MSGVKTVNSAIRTAMLLAITGVVGYGGWMGYDHYVRPGYEAKQAMAKLEVLRKKLARQTEEMKVLEKRNDQLETSIKLLTVDRRVANIQVLEKGVDENNQPYMEVRFTELDRNGKIIGSPKDFTLRGTKFYVDGWVATFEDKYVQEADELRAASLFSFKSIFGDAERPRDGHRLDIQSMEQGPPGIYRSEKRVAFEEKIWSDFWKVCNDRNLQKELGIRASYGDATYVEAEEGKTYQVSIRASGGMSLIPVEEKTVAPPKNEQP